MTPTARGLYQRQLPPWISAGRIWDHPEGRRLGNLARTPYLSSVAATGVGALPEWLQGLTEPAMAQVRAEAGKGAEEAVKPLLLGAYAASGAAILLAGFALWRTFR